MNSMNNLDSNDDAPKLRPIVDDDGGDKGNYVSLRGCEGDLEAGSGGCGFTGRSVWNRVKLGLVVVFFVLVGCAFLFWVGPYLMHKVVVPIISWVTTTLSRPLLAILVFSSVAVFPALLLPSSPSMWVAGITFGYDYGFLLLLPAVAVGVSLPYFIGSLFDPKIQEWLEKYPKEASFLRSAGEQNWINQLKSVILIRISPFPDIVYNYCSVVTNVKYGPYILGSLIGMVPETYMAIYSGILIRTLADASHKEEPISLLQIAINVIGFVAAATTTTICTIYAKKRLGALQAEDEPLLPCSFGPSNVIAEQDRSLPFPDQTCRWRS